VPPADDAPVNTPLSARILAVPLLALVLIGCASKTSNIVPLGDNTFSVTREASTGFTLPSSVHALKDQALQDATQYCKDHGKQLKVVSVVETKPLFMTEDFPKAKVVFKALDPGDPELKAPPPPPAPTVDAAGNVVSGGDLYTELTKLDELRQKGILTEKEFQEQKKRILKHYNN
jgi:Short C-terminal domain